MLFIQSEARHLNQLSLRAKRGNLIRKNGFLILLKIEEVLRRVDPFKAGNGLQKVKLRLK